ncbi:MAG: chemotaxis protein [Campylobacteraceae bacterium]|nr:chemotaxis protein [Campylobacteraceae bacterium]
MTQEELDALMAGDLDDQDLGETEASKEENTQETVLEDKKEDETKSEDSNEQIKEVHEYRADANMAWPPPPPTEDHKMVSQLDDVTRESEVKATEIFDKLESVNNTLVDCETNIGEVGEIIGKNIALFEKLVAKFPAIEQFKNILEDNKSTKEKLESMTSNVQMGEDEVMMAMDIMQYQDIHRQKIERVINVMRALSKYISLLFEGSIDDKDRVGSAVHIEGDESTNDLVTSEDIEAIIESLGKKK